MCGVFLLIIQYFLFWYLYFQYGCTLKSKEYKMDKIENFQKELAEYACKTEDLLSIFTKSELDKLSISDEVKGRLLHLSYLDNSTYLIAVCWADILLKLNTFVARNSSCTFLRTGELILDHSTIPSNYIPSVLAERIGCNISAAIEIYNTINEIMSKYEVNLLSDVMMEKLPQGIKFIYLNSGDDSLVH